MQAGSWDDENGEQAFQQHVSNDRLNCFLNPLRPSGERHYMITNNPEKADAEYKAVSGASGGGRLCTIVSADASLISFVCPVQTFPFLFCFLLPLIIRK